MLSLNFIGLEDLRKSKLFDAIYFREEFLKNKSFLSIAPSDVAYLASKNYWNAPISALFNARYYIASNSDLSNLDSPPILHYIRHGFAEGRSPSPLVDIDYIIEQLEPSLVSTSQAQNNPTKQKILSKYDGIRSLLHDTGVSPCPLFTNQYFLEQIDFDIGDALPIEIYFRSRGKHPQTGKYFEINQYINIDEYISENPDIKMAGVNPLEHIIEFGHQEGRLDRFFSEEFLTNSSLLHNNKLLRKPITFIAESNRSGIIGGPKWKTPFLSENIASLKHSKPETTKYQVLIGCVLYKNSDEDLERLRQAIQKQHTDSPELNFSEKYFVNDIENIERYIQIFGKDRVIPSSEGNIGFGKAHNVLMTECFREGDLYIGVNPDGYLLPGFVEALIDFDDFFEGNAFIQATTSPVDHPKWYDPITLDCNWVSGAAFAISKEIWISIAGFDPDIKMYCEDVDLSWRAKANGYQLKVCPNAKFFHDVTGRQLIDEDPSVSKNRSKMMLEGAYYLCKKWDGKEMAEKLKHELSAGGYIDSFSELPKPNTIIPHSVSEGIVDFKHHLRFAPSRYW